MINKLRELPSFKQFYNMDVFKEFHDRLRINNLRYKQMTNNITRIMNISDDSVDDKGVPLINLDEVNELIALGNKTSRNRRKNIEYFYTDTYKKYFFKILMLFYLSFFLKIIAFFTNIFIITNIVNLTSSGLFIITLLYLVQNYEKSLQEKYLIIDIQKPIINNPLKLFNIDKPDKFNETFEKEIKRGIKLSRNIYITDVEGNTEVLTEVDLLRLIVLSIINLNKYKSRNFILIYKKTHVVDTNYIMKLFSEEVVNYEYNDNEYKELITSYLDYFVEMGIFENYRIEVTKHKQPEIIFTPEFVQLLINNLAQNNSD